MRSCFFAPGLIARRTRPNSLLVYKAIRLLGYWAIGLLGFSWSLVGSLIRRLVLSSGPNWSDPGRTRVPLVGCGVLAATNWDRSCELKVIKLVEAGQGRNHPICLLGYLTICLRGRESGFRWGPGYIWRIVRKFKTK